MPADVISPKRRQSLDFAAVSHLGHSRTRNEDVGYVASERGLAIVADGVGGQGDGAWASRRAVDLIVHRLKPLGASDAREATMMELLQQVNRQMSAETRSLNMEPSGTTIAGIWAPHGEESPVIVFNVGDSSVFHLSSKGMSKLSQDHSLYQLWIDGGRVGREPGKRVIVQAMGISEHLTPHLASVRICKGESMLLCTDGLSGAVSIERMAVVMAEEESSKTVCDVLLCDALAGAATDNITISICRF